MGKLLKNPVAAVPANNYLTISDSIISGVPFSVSAWVLTHDVETEDRLQMILTIGDTSGAINNYELAIYNNPTSNDIPIGVFAVRDVDTPFDLGALYNFDVPIQKNVWYHMCGIAHDHNSRSLYVNGVLARKESTITINPDADLDSLFVGCIFFISGFVSGLRGCVSDVALWDVDLSHTEATSLALGARARKIRPNNLQGYWPMLGHASGEIDLSKNSNNLSLVGGDFVCLNPPALEDMSRKRSPFGLTTGLMIPRPIRSQLRQSSRRVASRVFSRVN